MMWQKTLEDCLSEEGYSVPKGTLLQQVKDLGEYWEGYWCSSIGTFVATIHKDFCEEVENDRI